MRLSAVKGAVCVLLMSIDGNAKVRVNLSKLSRKAASNENKKGNTEDGRGEESAEDITCSLRANRKKRRCLLGNDNHKHSSLFGDLLHILSYHQDSRG